MLIMNAKSFDLDYIKDSTSHFYGSQFGDVFVKVTSKPLDLSNGLVKTIEFYCFVWTGSELRKANELELYRFKNLL